MQINTICVKCDEMYRERLPFLMLSGNIASGYHFSLCFQQGNQNGGMFLIYASEKTPHFPEVGVVAEFGGRTDDVQSADDCGGSH